ncbi:MAG: PP0621 family protein [Gammaproteobacteria bacterium]|nr:PP0621 family protein [Gammaproteobacteria bacterium]
MGLIRFIIIALIIYLLILIFKRWAANKNPPSSGSQENSTVMVQCKTCKLHVPETEALKKNDEYYCSQEHLEGKQD